MHPCKDVFDGRVTKPYKSLDKPLASTVLRIRLDMLADLDPAAGGSCLSNLSAIKGMSYRSRARSLDLLFVKSFSSPLHGTPIAIADIFSHDSRWLLVTTNGIPDTRCLRTTMYNLLGDCVATITYTVASCDVLYTTSLLDDL